MKEEEQNSKRIRNPSLPSFLLFNFSVRVHQYHVQTRCLSLALPLSAHFHQTADIPSSFPLPPSHIALILSEKNKEKSSSHLNEWKLKLDIVWIHLHYLIHRRCSKHFDYFHQLIETTGAKKYRLAKKKLC